MADPLRQIPGPAGPLEALLDAPRGAARAAVVFAHPLPTEGGTMHTKVVFQAAKALARIGCVVLRFNFRGVGLSAGAWDNGRGELDDYEAAVAFMASEYPNLEKWAAGFSFGSHIATTVGADDGRVCALIAIAPPVDKYEFASVKMSKKPAKGSALDIPPIAVVRVRALGWLASLFLARSARLGPLYGSSQRVQNSRLEPYSGPKFIIHGERDELISLKLVRHFYAQLQAPKELVEIDRANHLFDGQASEVGDALADLLEDFSCRTQ